jgi:hypothetical protein
MKDKDILLLRQQLEVAKKLAEDNATAQCGAEEKLKEVEKNFNNYSKGEKERAEEDS